MLKEKRALDDYYDEKDRSVNCTEVFVGGLSHSIREATIREVFSSCGEIVEIRMMKDQSSISKGFCFVRFAEKESALVAEKEKNGIVIQGKRINVSLSLDQDCLFFGNIRKEWSVQEFETLVYRAFKNVISVDLATFPGDFSTVRRHQNRGFAFVRFSSHAAAARAYRIGSRTDFLLDGVHPAIDWAEKEPQMDPDEMAKIKTAFVGNLPKDVNEEYLRKLFDPIGKVEKVALSRKGQYPVGFVHFANRTDLDNAIREMDGMMVRGLYKGPAFKIQVSVARPAEKDRKRDREEEKNKSSSMPRTEAAYSYASQRNSSLDHNSKVRRLSNSAHDLVLDPYEAAVIALPSAVKERLLRLLRLGIGTRYDIDVHCINNLKELPESAAVAVLDQFLLSGGAKRDKGEYFASLVAKHTDKFGLTWGTSQFTRTNYLPRDSELHNKRVPLHTEQVSHSYSRDSRYSSAAGIHPYSSPHYDGPSFGRSRHDDPSYRRTPYGESISRSNNARYKEVAVFYREPASASASSSMAAYRTGMESDFHSRSSVEHPTEHGQIRFDPFTGEPYKFDPFTGEPIHPDPNPRRSGSLY